MESKKTKSKTKQTNKQNKTEIDPQREQAGGWQRGGVKFKKKKEPGYLGTRLRVPVLKARLRRGWTGNKIGHIYRYKTQTGFSLVISTVAAGSLRICEKQKRNELGCGSCVTQERSLACP